MQLIVQLLLSLARKRTSTENDTNKELFLTQLLQRFDAFLAEFIYHYVLSLMNDAMQDGWRQFVS